MLRETKKELLKEVEQYMEDNDHNTQSIKTKNPFPVSPRWICDLKHSVLNNTDKGFNSKKVQKLLKFLKVKYKLDGSTVVIAKIKTA